VTDRNTEDRISELEKVVAVKSVEIEMRLQKQDETLHEIKKVLVEQNKIIKGQSDIMIDIVKIQSRISEIEARQESMKQTIEDRKDDTDPLIIEARDFLSKFKLLSSLAGIIFIAAQIIIGSYINDNKAQITTIQTEIKELRSFHTKNQIDIETIKSHHDSHHQSTGQ
jgi:uncharacterized coiled-coil protein SlyX